MSRGKVARCTIIARLIDVDLGVEQERRHRLEVEARRAEAESRVKYGQPLQMEVQRRNSDGTVIWYDPYSILELASAEFLRDAITFDFALSNDGDVTIRVPAIKFSESFNDQLLEDGLVRIMKTAPQRIKLEDTIIYPGDEHVLESAKISLECKRETILRAEITNWTGEYFSTIPRPASA
jgi:hypothetical protein